LSAVQIITGQGNRFNASIDDFEKMGLDIRNVFTGKFQIDRRVEPTLMEAP
jgi:hypothetical protein